MFSRINSNSTNFLIKIERTLFVIISIFSFFVSFSISSIQIQMKRINNENFSKAQTNSMILNIEFETTIKFCLFVTFVAEIRKMKIALICVLIDVSIDISNVLWRACILCRTINLLNQRQLNCKFTQIKSNCTKQILIKIDKQNFTNWVLLWSFEKKKKSRSL